jgi:hypothetical protein
MATHEQKKHSNHILTINKEYLCFSKVSLKLIAWEEKNEIKAFNKGNTADRKARALLRLISSLHEYYRIVEMDKIWHLRK